MQKVPETLSDWFQSSKNSKAEFFQALPSLSEDTFRSLVEASLQRRDGQLRPLKDLKDEKRKEIPPESELICEATAWRNRPEQCLQYLLWHRKRLLDHQAIIARETPCDFSTRDRTAVADFLAMDTSSATPIIVETKADTAADSLTGALLQLLANWCFFTSAWPAFLVQLEDAGYAIASHVTQPQAVLAAPAKFYREVMRRSADPRRLHEARHAKRLLTVLEENFGLTVRFVEICDDWRSLRTGLRCSPYELSI